MKNKKKHNLLTKHIIQQVLPIFDELFKTLDEKFEQLVQEELTETYLKGMIQFNENLEKSKKKIRKINPYAAFLSNKEIQAEIRRNNPDLNFGELSKLKGKIWKNFSQENKDYYKKLAENYSKN